MNAQFIKYILIALGKALNCVIVILYRLITGEH